MMRAPEFIRFMRRCGFVLRRDPQMRSTVRRWESERFTLKSQDQE